MYRLICRKVVALAAAYALALSPTLPLLTAFAASFDLALAARGEICATTQSGAETGADHPNGHGASCALGLSCPAQDCGADGVLAAAAGSTAIRALRPAPLFTRLAEEGLLGRAHGAHFARAPPRA
jgi:hypothetical protein